MALADAMQMRGGGPVIFERAEAGRVPCTKRTLLKIDGGARNALNERIETALSYVEASGYVLPIVATVDPSRILDDKERAAVASFAPSALNEQELFIDSALSKGFTLDAQRYGARHLPDGSSYVTMRHAQSGAGLVVLSPHKYPDETTPGKYRNGVYNGYQALIKHGADLPGMSDFVFEGSDMVVVTGTHYGAMSVVNNLYEAHDLRVSVGSYHVIGDNQPESSRKPQAHLIEQGYVIEAIDRKSPQYPAIRAALFPQAA